MLSKFKRKKGSIAIFIFSITIISIIITTIFYIIHINQKNDIEYIHSNTNASKHFDVTFSARNKLPNSIDNKIIKEKKLNAYFHKLTIVNKTYDIISGWNLRINIQNDCYFNSAWCGKIEVHSKDKKKENVEVFDYKKDVKDKFSFNDFLSDYKESKDDTLIHLKKGDYILYFPNSDANEGPINPSFMPRSAYCLSNIGFIFYTNKNTYMDFDDSEIRYSVKHNYKQDYTYGSLVILGNTWLVALVIYFITKLRMKKAQKQLIHDETIIEEALSVFTQFFDAKDVYTKGHSQRVAKFSEKIAEKMGYSPVECKYIRYVALMHDCGKVYIPNHILKKPGKLTDEEFDIIKTHTTHGYEMLKDFSSIKFIQDGALYHHERYDGKGYPTGKKGEDIPLIGRIICVADSFDAMNSKRCYRNQLSKEEILSELKDNKGSQFDPTIVDVFIKLLESGEVSFLDTNNYDSEVKEEKSHDEIINKDEENEEE